MKFNKFTALLFSLIIITIIGCTDTSKVDSMLNDLESITDKTILVIGKVKSGDTNAISEMSSLTANYQSFNNNMLAAKDVEWTDEQRKRYLKILNKYQEALSKMR